MLQHSGNPASGVHFCNCCSQDGGAADSQQSGIPAPPLYPAVAAGVPYAAPDRYPAAPSPEPGGDVRGERAVAAADAGRAAAAAFSTVFSSRFVAICVVLGCCSSHLDALKCSSSMA
jgi:hypothetical protein